MSAVDFQNEVINRSHQLPVVVDFWAEWCAPCRVLGPVIEALASEAEGKWELVKVNTENNQEIAAQYQIRSIPAVKMFYRGEIIGEFMGALPRYQIERWLEQFLPDPAREALYHIMQGWENRDRDELITDLASFAQVHGDLQEAKLRLAQVAATVDTGKAREQLREVKLGSDPKMNESVNDVKSLIELMETQPDEDSQIAEQITQAQSALQAWNWEVAIQALIQSVMLNKYYEKELPRRATIAIFRLLGHAHELSKKYQRKFDMALY